MNTDLHPPQTDKPSQATSVEALEWRYIPVYEVVMGFAFALLGLISTIALIGGLLSGSSPSFDDLILVIAAAFIGNGVAVLAFRSVSQAWLRIRVQEDIEVHWWLRNITHRVSQADAQAVRLTMYISPIFGMRAEAILILSGKEQSIDLPILRHLLPSKKFRRDALNLAQALQIPLQIPDRNSIPPGFRSSFDALRIDSSNIVPDSTAQKQQPETEIEPLIEPLIEKLLLSPVTWQATGDGEYPHQLEFSGHTWQIRVNDWPEYETVYSLMRAQEAVRDLHEIPTNWKRP